LFILREKIALTPGGLLQAAAVTNELGSCLVMALLRLPVGGEGLSPVFWMLLGCHPLQRRGCSEGEKVWVQP